MFTTRFYNLNLGFNTETRALTLYEYYCKSVLSYLV
jgi:hypothetical protein